MSYGRKLDGRYGDGEVIVLPNRDPVFRRITRDVPVQTEAETREYDMGVEMLFLQIRHEMKLDIVTMRDPAIKAAVVTALQQIYHDHVSAEDWDGWPSLTVVWNAYRSGQLGKLVESVKGLAFSKISVRTVWT